MGKPEGKRPLGRSRRRWVDKIKMDLRSIGWDGMNWIDLAQDGVQWRALVNSVMNLRVPQNTGKFLSGCTTDGFSRRAQLHGAIETGGFLTLEICHIGEQTSSAVVSTKEEK
jgi:hypothetical protein